MKHHLPSLQSRAAAMMLRLVVLAITIACATGIHVSISQKGQSEADKTKPSKTDDFFGLSEEDRRRFEYRNRPYRIKALLLKGSKTSGIDEAEERTKEKEEAKVGGLLRGLIHRLHAREFPKDNNEEDKGKSSSSKQRRREGSMDDFYEYDDYDYGPSGGENSRNDRRQDGRYKSESHDFRNHRRKGDMAEKGKDYLDFRYNQDARNNRMMKQMSISRDYNNYDYDTTSTGSYQSDKDKYGVKAAIFEFDSSSGPAKEANVNSERKGKNDVDIDHEFDFYSPIAGSFSDEFKDIGFDKDAFSVNDDLFDDMEQTERSISRGRKYDSFDYNRPSKNLFSNYRLPKPPPKGSLYIDFPPSRRKPKKPESLYVEEYKRKKDLESLYVTERDKDRDRERDRDRRRRPPNRRTFFSRDDRDRTMNKDPMYIDLYPSSKDKHSSSNDYNLYSRLKNKESSTNNFDLYSNDKRKDPDHMYDLYPAPKKKENSAFKFPADFESLYMGIREDVKPTKDPYTELYVNEDKSHREPHKEDRYEHSSNDRGRKYGNAPQVLYQNSGDENRKSDREPDFSDRGENRGFFDRRYQRGHYHEDNDNSHDSDRHTKDDKKEDKYYQSQDYFVNDKGDRYNEDPFDKYNSNNNHRESYHGEGSDDNHRDLYPSESSNSNRRESFLDRDTDINRRNPFLGEGYKENFPRDLYGGDKYSSDDSGSSNNFDSDDRFTDDSYNSPRYFGDGSEDSDDVEASGTSRRRKKKKPVDVCGKADDSQCKNRSSGHYAHPVNAKCFVHCNNWGRAFVQRCPPGTSWTGTARKSPSKINLCV